MLCLDACVVQQLLASCPDDGEYEDPRGNSAGNPWWWEVLVHGRCLGKTSSKALEQASDVANAFWKCVGF